MNGWPAGGTFRGTRAGNAWRRAWRSRSKALPPGVDSRFERGETVERRTQSACAAREQLARAYLM